MLPRFATALLPIFLTTFSASAAEKVIHLKIDGTIHSGTESLIRAGLREAKAQKAQALFLELDTPGGMLDSTRDIVKLFLNSDVPVIVYVAPKGAHAGSAGTFITMAAHVAAMAPGTNIGAAHPVSATGSDPEKEGGKHLAQKIENDTAAFIESIARQRGRNVEWAKKAVIESDVVTEEKAAQIHVIDFIASTREEVLKKADGKKVRLESGEVTLKTAGAEFVPLTVEIGLRLKNWLADPTIMFLLILIAGMGFYVEMSHPGLILPAVAAGVAVILLMIATSFLPMTVIGLGLIVLGFALLIAEVYVTSFGLLGAAGIAAFAIGAMLLFDPSDSDLRVPRGMIFGAAAGIALAATVVAVAIGRGLKAPQMAGAEGLVGQDAVVQQAIAPGKDGRVFFNGEYWFASADEELAPGAKVRVVEMDGLKVHVRAAG